MEYGVDFLFHSLSLFSSELVFLFRAEAAAAAATLVGADVKFEGFFLLFDNILERFGADWGTGISFPRFLLLPG